MRHVLAVALLSVASWSVPASDQRVPNFSGTWSLVPGTIAPMRGPHGFLIQKKATIVHDATRLVITQVEPKARTVTITLDGKESRNTFSLPDRPVWTLTSRAGWDGGRLVIVSGDGTPGFFLLEKWAIDPTGRLEVEFTGPNIGWQIPITDTARYAKGSAADRGNKMAFFTPPTRPAGE